MRVELDLPAGAVFDLAQKREFRYSADGHEFATLASLAKWMAEHDVGDQAKDRTIRVARNLIQDEWQELSALLAVERVKTAWRRGKREEIRILQAELRNMENERGRLQFHLALPFLGAADELVIDKRLSGLRAREPEVVAQLKALEAELKEEFEAK